MRRIFLLTLLAVLLLPPASASAEEAGADPNAVIKDYCLAIADAAADARIAWQQEELKALEAKVSSKIDELEKKRAELEAWVARHDAMLRSANESLVGIYAKMEPETAAAQIQKIGQATAVSILSQLSARNASAILNEMPPEAAAALVKVLASPLGARPQGGGT